MSTSTTTPPSTFDPGLGDFSKLPPEIRNTIWEIASKHNAVEVRLDEVARFKHCWIAVSCKIYSEAAQMYAQGIRNFWSSTTFVLDLEDYVQPDVCYTCLGSSRLFELQRNGLRIPYHLINHVAIRNDIDHTATEDESIKSLNANYNRGVWKWSRLGISST